MKITGINKYVHFSKKVQNMALFWQIMVMANSYLSYVGTMLQMYWYQGMEHRLDLKDKGFNALMRQN